MKKYVKNTVRILVAILILVLAFMIVVDPLFQYHYPWFGMEPVISADAQYYVAGMAKNFDYNNAIIGTSMSQNFRSSWFDDSFNGDTVKLTIGGATPKDYRDILRLVLKHGDVEEIVMDLGNYFLVCDPNIGSWNEMPVYLYDDNLLNDVSYIFNKDILIVHGGYQIARNLFGDTTDMDTAFCWEAEAVYDKNELLDEVSKSAKDTKPISESEKEIKYNHFLSNLQWINELVEDNPEINFSFFIPPYSISAWYLESMSGSLDLWNSIYQELARSIVSHDNTHLYFFYDDADVDIWDLSKYRDTTHYNTEISKHIAECITSGKMELTENDCEGRIKGFFEMVSEVEYSDISASQK